jgi:hypothetical protein
MFFVFCQSLCLTLIRKPVVLYDWFIQIFLTSVFKFYFQRAIEEEQRRKLNGLFQ